MISLVLCVLLIAPSFGMKVGVDVVGDGEVRVEWTAVVGVTQYRVRLIPQHSLPSLTVLVDCHTQGDVCGVTLADLSNGTYEGKVTYSDPGHSVTPSTYFSTTFTVTNGTQDCRLPFTDIGGRCLLVETLLEGTWQEMSYFCFQNGGRLVVLDDANVMYFLVRFIYDNSLYAHHFWVGATDMEVEGEYRWVDGTPVRMGSPIWGYYWNSGQNKYFEEPNDATQRCVVLWESYFYHIGDWGCDNDAAAVCEQAL